jgi:fatty aldehyde-generating acyl-ACP reductase
VTIAKHVNIAVTTGNSYTVGTALEGTREAARLMGQDLSKVGGAGGGGHRLHRQRLCPDPGPGCPAPDLAGPQHGAAWKPGGPDTSETGLVPALTRDVKQAVRRADIIVAVSGAAEALIQAEDLKPGAVVCDVARPRDVSKAWRSSGPMCWSSREAWWPCPGMSISTSISAFLPKPPMPVWPKP